MATDNPVLEPADIFYGTTEATEPTEPTEVEAVTDGDEDITDSDDQEAEEDSLESTDNPGEAEEESEEDPEEKAELEDPGAEDEKEQELVYLDLDGKEVDLDEVRQWRDGHLMQADYTRKTQELADERKALKSQSEEIQGLKATLSDSQAELQALVEEDEAVNWAELKEYEPEEYIRLKEKADKRKAAVDKFKAVSTQVQISPEEIQSEQSQLFSSNPSWIDDNRQPTKAYKEDMKVLSEYWSEAGFTTEEINGMVRARYIETSLKAAKYDALQKKSKAFTKKAKKAPLTTKPKAKARNLKPKPKAIEDIFYNS